MAQIDNIVVIVVIGIFGAIIGVIYWVSRRFITKDVCDAKQDCVEAEIKNVHFRLTEIKNDMKTGFDEVKDAIKEGKQ